MVGSGQACQVPVFRYALERWVSDGYKVVLSPGKGGWTEKERAAFGLLESFQKSNDVPVNFIVEEGQAAADPDGGTMALYYPGRFPVTGEPPIWTGPLTEENVRSLVDSPVRRELAKRILEGQSAIWVVVESGNEKADAAAEELMAAAALSAGEKLQIPEGVVGRNEIEEGAVLPVDQENVLQSDVPLKIEFSVLRVRRDDPAESIFLEMLLNLEGDLHGLASETMVFPVFGRGRVLEPLVGKGVSEANAFDYSGYLCGACSCEVKDQNPGMDLLMAVNWDAAIEGSQVIVEKVLPPLEGTAVLSADQRETATGRPDVTSSGTSVGAVESKGVSPAILPLMVSLGVIVALVGVGSVVVMKRGRK